MSSVLLLQVQHFVNHKLGLSERQLQTVTWPEVARRIVQVCSFPPSSAMPTLSSVVCSMRLLPR